MDKLVYLIGPISGMSKDAATTWRLYAAEALADVGITALSPMRERTFLSEKTAIQFDFFDLSRAHVALANFTGASQVSIGSTFELAWAYQTRKPVVAVFDEAGHHQHPFVQAACQFIAADLETAIDVVKRLLLP